MRPPPRSIGAVGVSFSGVIRYAQTGFSSGSISVMIAASVRRDRAQARA